MRQRCRIPKSVGETMATNDNRVAANSGQPAVETDQPLGMLPPGPAARSRSFLNDGLFADSGWEPAGRGFDRSLWPDLQ